MTGAATAALPGIEDLQGWHAELALKWEHRGERTLLTTRRQRGPLVVQRPFYPEGAPCHLYLLHPPGGVVGGDSLMIHAEAAPGAHALVTTPGATKFYRSAGAQARQVQILRIGESACLEWLPQENILFPGADADLVTEVHLSAGARFIGWELHCLGRPVNAERFGAGRASFRLALYRDGRPLFHERLHVDGARDLERATGLRGQPVFATLVATGSDATSLEQARRFVAEIPSQIGITRVDDLLVARYLGDSTEVARRCLIAIWQALRPALLNRPPCPPRIWAT